MVIRSAVRWRSPVFVVLAVSTSVLIGRAAWPQTPQSDPLMALAERLDPKMPVGDVSLLVDASGSMSGRYATVRATVLRFAEGLSANESVTARAFAANITQPISGKGARARSLLDSGLPREPMAGTGTDLGLALSKALDDLDRPDAAPVQALFVLTDGLHQPPTDSPFSRDFVGDSDWRALRGRAHALAKRSHLIVYGLGIGGETDVGVLRRIFPVRNVEILSGDAASAGSAMARLQRQLRLLRLKTLLEQDLGQGKVTAIPGEPSARTAERKIVVPIVIHNAYQALPVTLSNLRLEGPTETSGAASAMLDAPSGLRLGPDQRSTVTMTIAIDRDLPRWALGRHRLDIRSSRHAAAEIAFEDRAALGILRFESGPRFDAAPADVEIGLEYGKPLWVVIGVVVAAVATIVGWKNRVRMLPPVGLMGTIAVQGSPEELAGRGKESLSVGPPDADIPLPGIGPGGESVELLVGRDGDYAQLAMRSGGFNVSVNGEAVSGERVLSDGDAVTLGTAEFVVLNDGRTPTCVRRPIVFVTPLLAFLALAICLIVI